MPREDKSYGTWTCCYEKTKVVELGQCHEKAEVTEFGYVMSRQLYNLKNSMRK